MPVLSLIDGQCLVDIFTDSSVGFSIALRNADWTVLEKDGVDTAMVVRQNDRYSQSEIADWIYHAGISVDQFDDLRFKYCPPDHLPPSDAA